MVERNKDANGTSFTVTCDHVDTTTGVSAVARVTTMHGLANYSEKTDKFNRPGHIFPLIARERAREARVPTKFKATQLVVAQAVWAT
jgi:3,4-dihydroxy 2-butanone 4-phosphate synthase/GTP cyclohydrolase II